MIRREMKISELLEKHPELLEVLAGYHPHFGKLRNRLLRKVMAPRVTIEQAARMAGVDPAGLIETLAKALGKEALSMEGGRKLEGCSDASVITLDVRGLPPPEPMMRILEALAHLPEWMNLFVLHERRPVFLYSKLEELGFEHITEEVAPGDVRITIRRKRID